MENYNHLIVGFLKNSELLQELARRIKEKRIRFTQRHGLLSWDEKDKYWLDLSQLDWELRSGHNLVCQKCLKNKKTNP